ncbi:hypothetical protein TN91_07045 [Rhodococcus ruber]|nr:hypothetical protein TN91_07045 [Rhodococcus ruber]
MIDRVGESIELVRAQWPDVQVVLFGPTAPFPLVNDLEPRAALICKAARDHAAACIDPAAGQWLTKENSGQFDAGDGSHLNVAGHRYLAERFLAEFARKGGPNVSIP